MISRINLICLLMCISLVVVHVLWLVTPTFHEMPLIDYYFYSAIVVLLFVIVLASRLIAQGGRKRTSEEWKNRYLVWFLVILGGGPFVKSLAYALHPF